MNKNGLPFRHDHNDNTSTTRDSTDNYGEINYKNNRRNNNTNPTNSIITNNNKNKNRNNQQRGGSDSSNSRSIMNNNDNNNRNNNNKLITTSPIGSNNPINNDNSNNISSRINTTGPANVILANDSSIFYEDTLVAIDCKGGDVCMRHLENGRCLWQERLGLNTSVSDSILSGNFDINFANFHVDSCLS